MNVLLSVYMEDIVIVMRKDHTLSGHKEYEYSRKLMWCRKKIKEVFMFNIIINSGQLINSRQTIWLSAEV